MATLGREIDCVAATDATVLVLGESGTGKELVARSIHARSVRAAHPFVAVNCGAIAAGLVDAALFGHERGSFTGAHQQHAGHFERAAGGTLFLDEIGEMPPASQVRLLRVLETRRFLRVGGSESVASDVRIVAASNRDLVAAVEAGRFRQDLLYRLAVFPIRVPPLRERGDDVVLLAGLFLDECNARDDTAKRFSRRSLQALRTRAFPGNVRELRNAVQRACILADDEVELGDAERPVAPPAATAADGALLIPVGTRLDEAERRVVVATLAHFSGDKRRAAGALGVSLKTLYNRIDAYRAAGRGKGV